MSIDHLASGISCKHKKFTETNLLRKCLIATLLKKGLIENPGNGVINRRNG
ncbi:MAG TPA: hypothetical protein VGK06_06700 [Methanosarcina sp.]